MTPLLKQLSPGKKIYFISDFHLGAPDYQSSREREKKIIRLLEQARKDAAAIYFLGDIFDFWFEYRYTIPKGYTRLLGKLAELSDEGLPMAVFTGNHDMWMFGYFPQELNIAVFHKPQLLQIGNKRLYIGHGDGLGPGDYVYKCLKWVFRNPFFQWIFSIVPPVIGMGIANSWSRRSRKHNKDDKYYGEKEALLIYSRKIQEKEHHDFYVFGHRHMPLDLKVDEKSRYINLGDWINFYSYAVFDGENMELKYFEKE
ncbi:MAG TPA: UDP-2,3-diacylglucosamine diphosphatase [Cytophagaceae bacterium]